MPESIRELLARCPVVTAPMAGLTDRAFREVLRGVGAEGLIYTEMVSDMALCYGNRKTFDLLPAPEEQGPLVVQLCGSSPEYLARAAQIVEQRRQQNIVMLDINMGCPAPKIVENGEGSRLMQNPELAGQLVAAVKQAVSLPVSVKLRLGWEAAQQNVLTVARQVVAAGAAAVAIHGRTREQFYAGAADWRLIAEAARQLPAPVIGNGDIFDVAGGWQRWQSSGCAGLMLGRGLLGNPWLARDLTRRLAGLPALPPPSPQEVLALALGHLNRQCELLGEYMAVRVMRSHLPFYLKGLPGAAAARGRLNSLDKAEAVAGLLTDFLLGSA